MLNNNTPFDDEDKELLTKLQGKKYLLVVNKIDLPSNLNLEEEHINISIKDNIGIDKLKQAITTLFQLNQIQTNDMTYISNARSISLLKQAMECINTALSNIDENYPIDIVELELKNAWEKLGEIIGETYTDELIDELFSRFCLGK